MPVVGIPITSPSGTHFTTRAGVEKFAGPFNSAVYADKNGEADVGLVDAAWEQALATTDAEIISAFRVRLFNGGVTDYSTCDLVPGDIDDDVDSAWLDETACWGATVRLYSGRGQADGGTSAGPSPDGKMETLWQRYLSRLESIRTGTAILATAAGCGITAEDEFPPVTIGDPVYPTVDADGLTVTPSNQRGWYRGLRWDANRGWYRW